MKHFKRAAALMLTLCALLALTACGSLQDKVESKLWETAAPALVQGNMDLLYKGACDDVSEAGQQYGGGLRLLL